MRDTMKKHLLMVVVLAICAGAGVCQTANWKEYQYNSDGFAVSAPSKPVLGTQTTNTAVGPLQLHIYTINVGSGATMMINVTDYGDKAKNSSAHNVFEGAKNNTLRAMNGK